VRTKALPLFRVSLTTRSGRKANPAIYAVRIAADSKTDRSNTMTKKLLLVLVFLCSGQTIAAEDKDGKPEAPAPEAKVWTTEHELRIGNRNIEYTATAGTMLMKNDNGEPVALIGYTAYLSRDDRKSRPILFAYNGGPGSASIWLHIGMLGPQRVVVSDAGFSPAGPFRRIENDYSILDETDLVMIDPVGTGFAKVVGKGDTKDFWGVDQDIKSVSDFIVQYVTENGRWASPKFILGESYGGIRSGGVSYYLLSVHKMALNGVILVSPFMQMAAGRDGVGMDLPHILFLPTFATTAWYHDALGALDRRPEDIHAFMDVVEDFAIQEYAPALLAGRRLSNGDRQSVLAGLSRYTGLSEEYWDRANLRVDERNFTQELLRTSGKTIGRADSRFKGESINKLAESAPYDPLTAAIGPPYVAAFMDYYSADLEVEISDKYVVSGGFSAQWDWSHQQPNLRGSKVPFANTAVDLEYAMKLNPAMKVLVQQGYFDLSCPYFATEYVVDHMDLTTELRQNIAFEYYEAGHTMYVHEPSMIKFKQDLADFIRSSY
jgi:carboxypeptidase C (cathepsin A)